MEELKKRKTMLDYFKNELDEPKEAKRRPFGDISNVTHSMAGGIDLVYSLDDKEDDRRTSLLRRLRELDEKRL